MSKDNPGAILIVDDVAENIQIVGEVLKRDGYKMAFATTGKSALEVAEQEDFDLILLDVMMPGMDGFEVCRALKASPRHADATIIFITAKTDMSSIIKGFELGGSDYIAKPFNVAELSARVKTHIQLRKHQQELQRLNLAKDRFISIIAQELKDPFVALNGVLKMIDEEFDTLEPQLIHDYASLSRKASEQLLGLIDNLLTWSTMKTDTLPFAPRTIDLGAVTSDIAEELMSALEGKKIGFENRVREGSFAFADEGMVRIVLKNLLSNATMFSNKGGVVAVEGEVTGESLTISVKDTGIGMTEEETSKLFQIDKKVKHEGTAGEKGTGMGLILCRELIEKNGGEIWLNSTPNKGTEVFFTLRTQAPEQPQVAN